nr:hypothetical protein [uncultured Mediterranean phage uvMED]
MKYKITEMDTYSMKVEYDDGSWALIPSQVSADKEYYLWQIKGFQPKAVEPVAIKDHPMKLGDEGTVGEGLEEEKQEPEVVEINYGGARREAYPQLQNQLEAMYDVRQGDDTKQKAIDGHIEIVKAKFPKDDKIYTLKELDEAITELKKDPKWTDD